MSSREELAASSFGPPASEAELDVFEKEPLPQKRLEDLVIVQRVAKETPLVEAKTRVGNNNRVIFKLENKQDIRSFKIRGAVYAMDADQERKEEVRRRGVILDSGGNHSQAAALAGRELGVPVTVIMASVVPGNKVKATLNFGAKDRTFTLDTSPPTFTKAKELAKNLAGWDDSDQLPENEQNYPLYLSPYDDPYIVRGAATAMTETMLQYRDERKEKGWKKPDGVHVPIGGGGLISGIADVNAEVGWTDVYGYGADGADSAARSLRAIREWGATQPQAVPGEVNLDVEGLAVKIIGNELFRRLEDDMIADIETVEGLADVGEAYEWYRENVMPAQGAEISNATHVWDNLPEVSSMVTVAGVLKRLRDPTVANETHVVLISGSNTDEESFRHTMEALREKRGAGSNLLTLLIER